ncbi:MAG: hypothetical protein M1837_005314 [Sclerophora amabilis]|nr:MAG: hypothetical protein M1837_005314 [Sclerophora amabilis]
MPYNTRRKSLSLPSLGIQLPHASRALAANRSPPPATSVEHHPSKKVKRSHPSSSPASPSTRTTEKPRKAATYEDTPPPSPRPSVEPKVDTEGINDAIVTGVIEQLEATGNKPQLVKELAAVLCNTLSIVESSANPQAIISSRLNSYLKRPWTALSPCPLAKTLIPSHPRRIYFFLTNVPHQPLPSSSSESPLPSNRRSIISPSLSSEDDEETRKRTAASPSPEVDLSPEFEDADEGPPTPAGSFNGSRSLSRDGTLVPDAVAIAHNHRAVSPPLEGDEKEFEQTASVMQSKRSMSDDRSSPNHGDQDLPHISIEDREADGHSVQESEEKAAQRNIEAAAALFGQAQHAATTATGLSSPLTKPAADLHLKTATFAIGEHDSKQDEMEIDVKTTVDGHPSILEVGWDREMRSPENIELDELDDLLGGF